MASHQVNLGLKWCSGKLWLLCSCFHQYSVKSRWQFSPFRTQIRFKDRKKRDVGNDCLLSVDGTDFCIAMGWSKSFYSFKFKRSGLQYEVGLCIKTGDICWWSGPYAPRMWNDLSISEMGWWHIWSLGGGLRLLGVTVAAHLSMLNAPMVCWQTLIQQLSWWRQEFGVDRQPSMNGLRIGQFYVPRTVTNFRNTKQFLALLLCLPSFLLQRTLCSM